MRGLDPSPKEHGSEKRTAYRCALSDRRQIVERQNTIE